MSKTNLVSEAPVSEDEDEDGGYGNQGAFVYPKNMFIKGMNTSLYTLPRLLNIFMGCSLPCRNQ